MLDDNRLMLEDNKSMLDDNRLDDNRSMSRRQLSYDNS